MNAKLRNLVKRIFYRDIQAMGACCAFWAGDEDGFNEMPLWAKKEIENVMNQEKLDGTWKEGFSFILNEEHILDDDRDIEFGFSWENSA